MTGHFLHLCRGGYRPLYSSEHRFIHGSYVSAFPVSACFPDSTIKTAVISSATRCVADDRPYRFLSDLTPAGPAVREPSSERDESNLRFRISDLRCRNRPISRFPPAVSTSRLQGRS